MAQAAMCRNSIAAAHFKVVSIFTIFVTSVMGVSMPVMLARYFQGKSLYDIAILVIKCFAAGVILATSLVHVLPDAFAALSDCQVASQHPWKDFPFAGLVILLDLETKILVKVVIFNHWVELNLGSGALKGDPGWGAVGSAGGHCGELSRGAFALHAGGNGGEGGWRWLIEY